jgi:hypothetical protein
MREKDVLAKTVTLIKKKRVGTLNKNKNKKITNCHQIIRS